ncbi:MAG: hypothetical protein HY892_14535 [Deltaproteobacteria bacterium]|nr:hypothetical protein [Deltaproteobacteria bacterium]
MTGEPPDGYLYLIMDFYPENILLEITALLNAPLPPAGPAEELERSGIAFGEFQRIWWLECFLRAEPEAFREKFLALPAQEQQSLAAQIFRWFLYRPRLQRLYPARSGPAFPARWELVREGSLVRLAGAETAGTPAGIYYIFPHGRIWPDLLNQWNWVPFLTSMELINLEADLEYVSGSRLTAARERSERLRSLLTRPGPDREVEAAAPPEPPRPGPPGSPVNKRGRKKKSAGQLSLFD